MNDTSAPSHRLARGPLPAFAWLACALLIGVALGACGSSTRPVSADAGTYDGGAQLDLVALDKGTDGGSDAVTPTDLPAGCGSSWIDGMLSSTYFALGCPATETCPIQQTMTLSGKTGWFVPEGRGCVLKSGFLLTARVVLERRSTVSLELTTAVKMDSETSFRNQCQLGQCSTLNAAVNTATLDAGEHTVEVFTAQPGAFYLTVTIVPYRK